MKAVWSGSIKFGLINIPVKLYPAIRERRLGFDYLRKQDLCRIRNVRVCEDTGEEVSYQDIVRGYKYDNKYMVVTDEDFRRANVEKNHSIKIIHFTKEHDIDPKYFEKPYFLEPDLKINKSYVLLREALRRSEKVALIRFVLKTQEHLGIIKPYDNLLVLNQLRFEHEIRYDLDLKPPYRQELTEKELDMAINLVNMQTQTFDSGKYKDTYTEELKKTIISKTKTGKTRKVKERPKPTSENQLNQKLEESIKTLG